MAVKIGQRWRHLEKGFICEIIASAPLSELAWQVTIIQLDPKNDYTPYINTGIMREYFDYRFERNKEFEYLPGQDKPMS